MSSAVPISVRLPAPLHERLQRLQAERAVNVGGVIMSPSFTTILCEVLSEGLHINGEDNDHDATEAT